MKIWVTILIVSLIGVSSFAKGTCSSLFAETKAAKTETASSKKQLKSIVEGVAKSIERIGRTPSEKEIAEAIGVPESAIAAFLAKKSSPDIPALIAIAKQEYPEVFKSYEARLAKKAAEYLEENFTLPTTKQLAESLEVSEKDVVTIYGGNKAIFSRISEYERKSLDKVTDALIKTYVKAARTFGRSPILEEVAAVEGSKFTVESLESLIGKDKLIADINDLFRMAEKRNPKSLKGVHNLEVYNEAKFESLMKDIKDGERLVVTVGVAGAPVNKEFLSALKTYYANQRAPLYVRPINNETTGLDPALQNERFVHVLISEIELSPDLALSNIAVTAKQKNPLTGLDDIGPRGRSLVIGATKVVTRIVPTKDNVHRPHMLMTTGALNDANVYQGGLYVSRRTDYIAEANHFMGALVIEKTSGTSSFVLDGPRKGAFHVRHIQYIPEKQGFMDLNRFYTATGVTKERIEAVNFGDTHVAHTDQVLAEKVFNFLREMMPKKVFLDDLFDGRSISHYERDKLITMAKNAEKNNLKLEEELDITVDYLRAMIEAAPKDTVFYIKDANHNNWVHRYLESGRFMYEAQNTGIGLELAPVMKSGKNPIEYYFAKKLGSKYMNRIIFLKPNESHKVGPAHRAVEMGEHGDKGANGAKGSFNSFIRGMGGSSTGHSHTSQRYNNTASNGTTSENPGHYAQGGMSNWIQGLQIVGPNGEQQILMFRHGEWYRDSSQPLQRTEEFFEDGFPFAKPNNGPTSAVQVDQYSSRR